MIYLGDYCTNIQLVADQWELKLRRFLFNKRKNKLRINDVGIYETYFEKMFAEVEISSLKYDEKELIREKLDWFKNNFRKIILADENKIDELSKESAPQLLSEIMKNLYEDFTQQKVDGVSNAHYFFRELNIRTCPYCNRHYTFTLDETVRVAPEFDHFYDKAKHPLLAVSFYNLVPSCHTCNHVKGNKNVKINPFFSGFKRKFELQNENGERMPLDEIIKQKKASRIGFGGLDDSERNNSKRIEDEQRNIETFGLQELYGLHDDYINEIIEKTIAYNPTVQQTLVEAFQDQAYSPQQVYDFVWGKYLNDAQYQRRPLSKLTKDILEQLGTTP